MARNPDKKRCKATNRKGEKCGNWAVKGYDVCYYHGARGGAPKKNKNAVTTGEHEAIWFDTLDEEEKKLIDKVVLNKIKQTNNEIKLTEIRERRMLKRIQKLKNEELTTTSFTTGIEKGKETELIVQEETLSKIQAIEEALTRVQNTKIKLIETKHKLELDSGITKEKLKAQIEKLKADTNRITGVNEEIEDLSAIYKEIYGDTDGN
jgi:uncharacterized protein YjcR